MDNTARDRDAGKARAIVKSIVPDVGDALPGIVTFVILLESSKAQFPMQVTGSPLIVLGMTTVPSEPV